MAPTLEQSTDTSALGVDGNTPTCSIAGDDYGHLSSKALKQLCIERGLAVRGDHAALVGRLRAGKNAGPKSSKERMAKSRANRTEEQKKADRALNTEQVSAHRVARSQAKVVADKARNADGMEQARDNRTKEEVVADRALNTEQKSAHRVTRSQAKVVADRARNAGWMEQARATRSQAKVVADRALNTDQRTKLREKESPDEKEEKNKRRRDQQKAVRVNTDHIADLTRGNVRTPKWKVPGKDFHVDGHTSHPEAAMLLLYLSAGIGWNDPPRLLLEFRLVQPLKSGIAMGLTRSSNEGSKWIARPVLCQPHRVLAKNEALFSSRFTPS